MRKLFESESGQVAGRALILGIAVAQIAPLSVAAMAGSSRMSPRAKAALLAWGGDSGQVIGAPAGADLASYLGNLAFAGTCLSAWPPRPPSRLTVVFGCGTCLQPGSSKVDALGHVGVVGWGNTGC
ncbi:hypothetical protein [Nonomuraea wenchangensis]|uniref:hypothetical protein n=1 Tax=Nonomuraea wenchangensis TaxID=568860 RepID=UPI00331D103F